MYINRSSARVNAFCTHMFLFYFNFVSLQVLEICCLYFYKVALVKKRVLKVFFCFLVEKLQVGDVKVLAAPPSTPSARCVFRNHSPSFPFCCLLSRSHVLYTFLLLLQEIYLYIYTCFFPFNSIFLTSTTSSSYSKNSNLPELKAFFYLIFV